MFLAKEHETVEVAGKWYWRCCYGCHGCSRELFGPFTTQAEAAQARKEWRFQ